MVECTILDIVFGRRRCVEKLFVPLRLGIRCIKKSRNEHVCAVHCV